MKKLLIAIGLSAVTLVTNGQNFQSLKFLDVFALSVTNTAGYTNTMSYFGGSSVLSTNTTGLQYTNRNGTWTLIPATNAVTGFVSVSNGVGFFTNDTTALCKDIPFHADRNGNVTTNYTLNMAASFNGTSTGAVVCVFAPIVSGNGPSLNPSPQPFISLPTPTLLDLAHTITVAFPVLNNGSTNETVSVNWAALSGYKGLRLLSAGMTNSLGQAWIQDISAGTYVP